MSKKWLYFGLSSFIIALGIISICVQGFSKDIDFAGGVMVAYDLKQCFDVKEMEDIASKALGIRVSSVQLTQNEGVTIKFGYPAEIAEGERVFFSDSKVQSLTEALKERYDASVPRRAENDDVHIELVSQGDVAPSAGAELMRNAFWMSLWAVIAILVYVTFRFEFLSGLTALAALIHDIAIMLALYSLFKLPINTSFIAAILTILGYSINDTIVIFDRIRENTRIARKESYGEIVNKSVSQTMRRSINTSITTLITVVLLFILGVPSVKEFALPIMIGVLSGTYSSVFIAGPLWALIKDGGKK